MLRKWDKNIVEFVFVEPDVFDVRHDADDLHPAHAHPARITADEFQIAADGTLIREQASRQMLVDHGNGRRTRDIAIGDGSSAHKWNAERAEEIWRDRTDDRFRLVAGVGPRAIGGDETRAVSAIERYRGCQGDAIDAR